jgi:nucleotidyltransferase/DNA polymerase involved in DNA repair
MDAFYASIEQMDYPEYRGKPVVVGADPRGGQGRGVVSAASYEARRYGIHSALPISTAYRRCPHAVYTRPRFRRYEEFSRKVMSVLSEFSPVVEQISIDEAFLDCTGTERLFGAPRCLGMRIKERIRVETGLTASVGIATNKSIAKIASDLRKPDGLCVCDPGRERDFMAELPIKRLWGVGEKTVQKLEAMGFEKVRDVQNCPPDDLKGFGVYGTKLWDLANGIDDRPVTGAARRKSISQEITFHSDVDRDEYVEHVLFRITDSLTRRMRREGLRGRTVNLKIRLAPFETHTRSQTLEVPVNDVHRVREAVIELFRRFDRRGRKIRLVGVGLSKLEPDASRTAGQLGLFAEPEDGDKADRLLDQMKERFGDKVTRAAFLPPRQ